MRMSHSINGIGVYPLQIVAENGILKDSGCSETTFRCKSTAEALMEQRVKYRLVCEVKIDNIHDIGKTTIEGSVKRTFGPEINNMTLAEKKIAEPQGQDKKIYRQWWDWPDFPNWKRTGGEYHVCIRMKYRKATGGNAEEIAKKTMPVIFKKPDYEHGEKINKDC